MVDSQIVPAIRAALRENEIGNQSPYQLSYARLGSSGGSFGIFQGDCHVDERARAALRDVLRAASVAAGAADRIVEAVSQRCPDGSPLGAADQQSADNALSSPAGRVIVDRMDEGILAVILNETDSCLDAAQSVGLTIEPAAQIALCLWVNMTGAPTSVNDWIKGASVGGAAPPQPPMVLRADVVRYLTGTNFFRIHPRNLRHFQESVDAGVAVLPASAAPAAPAGPPAAAAAPPIAAPALAPLAGFVDRLIRIAATEWEFFGRQTYDIAGNATVIGHKEGEDGFYQRIGTYWLAGTSTHGIDGRDHASPWSAAFISWVMKTAGAGQSFRYSTQHSVYVYQAIRDRLNGRAAAGFWAWRLNEYKPKTGDLVCWARQSGIDYDNQADGNYAGHCDIVVAVEAGQVFVVGGNVGDSVTRRPLPLDAAGYLAPSYRGESLFAVMEDRLS